MKLIIHTQYRENYALDRFGNYIVGSPFYKNKGGDDIEVADLTLEQASDAGLVSRYLQEAARQFTHAGVASITSVASYSIIGDDELVDCEKATMNGDGSIDVRRRVHHIYLKQPHARPLCPQ